MEHDWPEREIPHAPLDILHAHTNIQSDRDSLSTSARRPNIEDDEDERNGEANGPLMPSCASSSVWRITMVIPNKKSKCRNGRLEDILALSYRNIDKI